MYERGEILVWNLTSDDATKKGAYQWLAEHWMVVLIPKECEQDTIIIHYGMNGESIYKIETLREALQYSLHNIHQVGKSS